VTSLKPWSLSPPPCRAPAASSSCELSSPSSGTRGRFTRTHSLQCERGLPPVLLPVMRFFFFFLWVWDVRFPFVQRKLLFYYHSITAKMNTLDLLFLFSLGQGEAARSSPLPLVRLMRRRALPSAFPHVLMVEALFPRRLAVFTTAVRFHPLALPPPKAVTLSLFRTSSRFETP